MENIKNNNALQMTESYGSIIKKKNDFGVSVF